jgi:hypothetical protein
MTDEDRELASHETTDPAEDSSDEDEERSHREHIARTGEPKRDRLGNAEGAS